MTEERTYEAPGVPAEARPATFIETMLLVILAQQDCLLARLRVEPDELREAVATKFAQAGCDLPPGLTIA